MVTGVLIFLIVFCFAIAIAGVAVSANADIKKLRRTCAALRTDLVQAQITQRQLDVAIKNLQVRRPKSFTMGYRSVSGDMDLIRDGQVATVKATFRPNTYV